MKKSTIALSILFLVTILTTSIITYSLTIKTASNHHESTIKEQSDTQSINKSNSTKQLNQSQPEYKTFTHTYKITSINTQTGEYYGTSTTSNNGIYFDNSIPHPSLKVGDTIKVTFKDYDDNITNIELKN